MPFLRLFLLFFYHVAVLRFKKVASTNTKMPIFCLKMGAPKQLQEILCKTGNEAQSYKMLME